MCTHACIRTYIVDTHTVQEIGRGTGGPRPARELQPGHDGTWGDCVHCTDPRLYLLSYTSTDIYLHHTLTRTHTHSHVHNTHTKHVCRRATVCTCTDILRWPLQNNSYMVQIQTYSMFSYRPGATHTLKPSKTSTGPSKTTSDPLENWSWKSPV